MFTWRVWERSHSLALCPGALVLEEINMGLAPRQVPTKCSMSAAKKQPAKAAFEIKKGAGK
jgi:hypothetical protein